MNRLAYVAPDNQLHLLDLDREEHTQLTLSLASNPLLVWGQPDLPANGYSWPCWSPSGNQIACFQFPDGEDVSPPVGLHVVEIDGLRQTEVLQIPGRVPIYANWQPNGEGLGILMQQEDEVELGYCRLDELGKIRILEAGAPLFFTWAADSRRVFVRAGNVMQPNSNRLVVRDAQGEMPDEVPPQTPGHYCCPLVIGDRLIQVDRKGEINRLISTNYAGEDIQPLLEFEGLGAVVRAAGQQAVIFSAAPKSGERPYRGATWLNIQTGERTRLTDDDCIAFFWSKGGQQLIYVTMDRDNNSLGWCSVRAGETPQKLVTFWPSPEMLFYLHFFDQFVDSHRLVSPDGRFLVFSGHLAGEGTTKSPPSLMLLDLHGQEKLRTLTAGSFGCFAP